MDGIVTGRADSNAKKFNVLKEIKVSNSSSQHSNIGNTTFTPPILGTAYSGNGSEIYVELTGQGNKNAPLYIPLFCAFYTGGSSSPAGEDTIMLDLYKANYPSNNTRYDVGATRFRYAYDYKKDIYFLQDFNSTKHYQKYCLELESAHYPDFLSPLIALRKDLSNEMNGIIEGKSIEKTIPDIITKDSVLFCKSQGENNWYELYSDFLPNNYYALCIAPETMSGLLADSRPNAYGLYYINRANKSIKNIWYEANKDYSASQYNPSRYQLERDENAGRIYSRWYSDSGRSGVEESVLIGFLN